jgi:hypothetical protein
MSAVILESFVSFPAWLDSWDTDRRTIWRDPHKEMCDVFHRGRPQAADQKLKIVQTAQRTLRVPWCL